MSLSSTVASEISDSEALHRLSQLSVSTNNTSISDFLAAVATEPPRAQDYSGYPAQTQEVNWPLPQRRTIAEPTDELSSAEKLAEASNIPLFDGDGNTVTFRDLYLGGNSIGERRLFLFIRHWHCWGCQQYVQHLTRNLDPAASSDGSARNAMPTKIILIGIGHPALIKSYMQRTNSPYETYSEPSLRLLKLLGCHRWGGLIWRFGKRPEYSPDMNHMEMTYHSLSDKYRSVYTDTLLEGTCSSDAASAKSSCSSRSRSSDKSGPEPHTGLQGLQGPLFQVGGEFLFEDGQLVWCHRMKSMRSHVDVKTLRRVLEIKADDDETMEMRMKSKWIQQEDRPPSTELRREAEALQKAAKQSEETRQALAAPPMTDEQEDRYLQRQLGRKPSMASVRNGLHVVRDPNGGRARLTRDMWQMKEKARISEDRRSRGSGV